MPTAADKTLVIVLLFAISFTLIGWATPVLYASHAPESNFISIHSFEVQNVNTDAESHYVCLDRTVKRPAPGKVYTELYLINGDVDKRIEVDSSSRVNYLESGRKEIITELSLPDNVSTGEYQYLMVMELHLADGRVERSFSFESESFVVSDDIGNATLKNSCA